MAATETAMTATAASIAGEHGDGVGTNHLQQMAVGMMILPGCCYCRAGPVWVVPGWFKLVVVVVGWWVVRCVPALGRILKKETWIFLLTCDHDTVLVRSKSVAVA